VRARRLSTPFSASVFGIGPCGRPPLPGLLPNYRRPVFQPSSSARAATRQDSPRLGSPSGSVAAVNKNNSALGKNTGRST
jgi:hypothetical protein